MNKVERKCAFCRRGVRECNRKPCEKKQKNRPRECTSCHRPIKICNKDKCTAKQARLDPIEEVEQSAEKERIREYEKQKKLHVCNHKGFNIFCIKKS